MASEQSDDWKRAVSHLPLLVSLPEDIPTAHLATELSWDTTTTALANELRTSGLPPLATLSCLPYLFGVSPKLISAMAILSRRYYREFSQPKRAGGERHLHAPRRFLKVIQWWISDHILNHYEAPECVTGFVKGKSIFLNAGAHLPARNLMVVDVQDFFPSVPQDRVTTQFAAFGFPFPVSRQLASLCCLDGHLPQGAPTSPQLANMVFLPADGELDSLAQNWGCRYTRYADDLCFSGDGRFTAQNHAQVEEILKGHGFSANPSKSRIIGPGARKLVTGLVVNVKAQPPHWKRHLWRAMFHRAQKHPHEFCDRVATLSGIASFVGQYSPALAATYRDVARHVAQTCQSD